MTTETRAVVNGDDVCGGMLLLVKGSERCKLRVACVVRYTSLVHSSTKTNYSRFVLRPRVFGTFFPPASADTRIVYYRPDRQRQ